MRNETNSFSGWAVLSIYVSVFGFAALVITGLAHLLRFESPWGVALAAADVAIIALYTVRSRDFEFLTMLLIFVFGMSCCLGFCYFAWWLLSPELVQTGHALILTPNDVKQGVGWFLVVIATVLAVGAVVQTRENSLKHSEVAVDEATK